MREKRLIEDFQHGLIPEKPVMDGSIVAPQLRNHPLIGFLKRPVERGPRDLQMQDTVVLKRLQSQAVTACIVVHGIVDIKDYRLYHVISPISVALSPPRYFCP